MKLLLVQILGLVLMIWGAQSLDCKVCNEGVDYTLKITDPNYLDDICSEEESANIKTCQDGEDACVQYSTTYSYDDNEAIYTGDMDLTNYRCAVSADLDGSESPFCKGYEKESEDKLKTNSDKIYVYDYVCDVDSVQKEQVEGGNEGGHEGGHDCEKEFCNATEALQLKFFLVCAATVLYGFF